MKTGSFKIPFLLLVVPLCGLASLWACGDTGPSPIGVHPDDPQPTTGDDAATPEEAGMTADAGADGAPAPARDAGDAGDAGTPRDAGDAGDADPDAR